MKNYLDLTGDVAIVTGASSGLGVQFAKALASQGAKLALFARREEKLKEVAENIENEFDAEVKYYVTDVTDSKKVSENVGKVIEDFGKIDILVNNAGLGLSAPTTETSDEDWQKMMNINVNSLFYMAREVAKNMKENGYGRIVNLGSIHSSVALANGALTMYTTTKGAVENMTKALAVEWAKDGITVNAIGPAYFASEMTGHLLEDEAFNQFIAMSDPMGRTGKPGELDTALLMFASHHSSYTTGQLLTVDGGWIAI